MAIRTQSGETYKLRGPPAVRPATLDLTRVTLHNLEFETIPDPRQKGGAATTSPRPAPPRAPPAEKALEAAQPEPVVEAFLAELLDETRPEVFNPVETFPPEVVEADPQTRSLGNRLKHVVIAHCLPITYREVRDDFYGDRHQAPTWGGRYTIECVIVEMDDLEMTFWSTAEVPAASVIYPARYKAGGKLEERRWWQVEAIQPRSGGFVHRTSPSSQTPSFSD